MSRVCCVQGCPSIDSDDVTYFPFPVASRQRRLWQEAIHLPRSKGARPPSPVVCSRHFGPECTEMARGKLRLKPHSTPHLFPDGVPPHSTENEIKDGSLTPDDSEDEEPSTNNRKRKKTTRKNSKKSRKRRKTENSDLEHEENENDDSNSSKSESNVQESDTMTSKDNQENETKNLTVQGSENTESTVQESEKSVDGEEKSDSAKDESGKMDLMNDEGGKMDSTNDVSGEMDSVNNKSGKEDSVVQETENNREIVKEPEDGSKKVETVELTPDIEAIFMNTEQLDGSVEANDESGKKESVVQDSETNSEIVKEPEDGSKKVETVEFTPDIEAFFMDTEHLDGSFDDNCPERCTIECVPEVVLGCEDMDSESELPKDDIEDIISNYHIKSNRKLAERLADAQGSGHPKEDIEDIIANYQVRSNRKLAERLLREQKNEELQQKQNSSVPPQNKPSEPSKENSKTQNETLEQGTSISSNEDEDVEFISSETLKTNYIEVPVEFDADSKEKSPSNDCMMLLEDVQVSIDPATLFPEDGGDQNHSDSSVQFEDEKPANPISLVTSSDESDVVIQEPHIDTVEVSDEDEDDIPLVKLVHSDSSDTVAEKKSKKLTSIFWGRIKEYNCYECKYTTTNNKEYQTHKANHSRVIQVCEICNYTSASETQFLKHKKKHKDEKRFKCQFCEYRAKHKMSLVYHLKSHENVTVGSLLDVNFGASDMSVNSVSDRSVKSVKGYKKTKKVYRCGSCKYSARIKADVIRHQRTCGVKVKVHACNKCEYETNRRSDLQRHIQRRHKDDCDDVDDDEYKP